MGLCRIHCPKWVFTFAAVSGIEQSANTIRIEGYLFKRGQNAFRTWNRRWFYLENNKLCYSKRTGDEVTVMEEDLRICLVRPLTDFDRRYCFEIISPTKSHVLQVSQQQHSVEKLEIYSH